MNAILKRLQEIAHNPDDAALDVTFDTGETSERTAFTGALDTLLGALQAYNSDAAEATVARCERWQPWEDDILRKIYAKAVHGRKFLAVKSLLPNRTKNSVWHRVYVLQKAGKWI